MLTVSTCGSPADCPPDPDHLTIVAAAEVSGDVALESGRDGRVEAPITKDAPIVDGVFRCEARLSATGGRFRSDTTSIRPLPASLSVSCVRSVGTSSRLLSFSLPIGELRDGSVVGAGERTVPMRVSMGSIGSGASSCEAEVGAVVRVDAARSSGGAAPGPAHVTPDFERAIDVSVRVAGETTSTSTDRPCTTRLDGTFAIDARLGPESFTEAATNDCL